MWALKSLRCCRRHVRWQIGSDRYTHRLLCTVFPCCEYSCVWVVRQYMLQFSSETVGFVLEWFPTNPNPVSAFPSWKSRVLICRASTKPAYTNEAGMRRTHWRFVQLLKCSAQSLHWDSNLWPWQCYCLTLPTEPLQSILIKAHVSKTEYSHPHGNTEVKAATNREVFLNIKVILFVSLLLFSGSFAFKKLIMAPAELSAAWLSAASRKAK